MKKQTLEAPERVLLTEDQTGINRVDKNAKEWLSAMNMAVDAWDKLGILTPYNVSYLFDNDFRQWYFDECKRTNPMLQVISIDAFVMPPLAHDLKRVSDWLRHEDTKIMYFQTVKFSGGRYVPDTEGIERLKDTWRKYATSPSVIKAIEMAEQVAKSYNAFAEFALQEINGDNDTKFADRNTPMQFLEWEVCNTPKGSRQFLKVKKSVFVPDNSPINPSIADSYFSRR